jgi:hypothetical protein
MAETEAKVKQSKKVAKKIWEQIGTTTGACAKKGKCSAADIALRMADEEVRMLREGHSAGIEMATIKNMKLGEQILQFNADKAKEALDSCKCETQMTVIKRVNNRWKGTAKPYDFIIKVTGDNVQPSSEFKGSSSGTTVTLNPGSFSVSEYPIPGYKTISKTGCTGTITEGEAKTCIITNEDICSSGVTSPPPSPSKCPLGTLIVIKKVINNDGGTAKPSDFAIAVNSSGDADIFFGSDSGVKIQVFAGPPYSIEELYRDKQGFVAAQGRKYMVSFDGPHCGTQTIGEGETKTCTITNNDCYDGPILPPGSPLRDCVTAVAQSAFTSSTIEQQGGADFAQAPTTDQQQSREIETQAPPEIETQAPPETQGPSVGQ